ncbi:MULTISPECIES: hypothetical protein [unclassified Bradyrhizobium]|uniref:hypothetical protein n=1 Tax=unclassified Bradyrhizobium TaxID=2631580 RepID=UPI0028E3A525|nr:MULTISPECIES: hypothetical protein [unclassified Bradyrhizobium]
MPTVDQRVRGKTVGTAPPRSHAGMQQSRAFAHPTALSFVIASEAKQSRVPATALDCFVATLLAMTMLIELPPPHRRPGERRDPYRVIYQWRAVADIGGYNDGRWLWAPAFAGATSSK